MEYSKKVAEKVNVVIYILELLIFSQINDDDFLTKCDCFI